MRSLKSWYWRLAQARVALVLGLACGAGAVVSACSKSAPPTDAGAPAPLTEPGASPSTWVDIPNEACDALNRHGREEGEKIIEEFGSRACREKGLTYAEYRCEGHAQAGCRAP